MDLGLNGIQSKARVVDEKRRRKRSLKKTARVSRDTQGREAMMVALPSAKAVKVAKVVGMESVAMDDEGGDSALKKKGVKMVLKVKPKVPKAVLEKKVLKKQVLGKDRIKSARGVLPDNKTGKTHGQKAKLAQRSTAHVSDAMKEGRERQAKKKLELIRKAVGDGSFERGEANGLLDYLRELRNHHDGGRLSEEQADDLSGLNEIGFSWLDATFKAGRFRKSVAVRFAKPNWTKTRLRADPWVGEMQANAGRGELPAWAQQEMDKLLDAAPVL